jgi:hypothetical protein
MNGRRKIFKHLVHISVTMHMLFEKRAGRGDKSVPFQNGEEEEEEEEAAKGRRRC